MIDIDNLFFTLSVLPSWLKLTMVFLFALCVGSFINVEIIRRPRLAKLDICGFVTDKFGKHKAFDDEYNRNSWVLNKRSECTSCGANLKWYHNIPLLSFMALKGRCSSCESAISYQYPFIELLTAVAGLLSFHFLFNEVFSTMFALYMALVFISIVICAIDIKSTDIFDCHSVIYVLILTLMIATLPDLDLNVAFVDSALFLFLFLMFIKAFAKIRELVTGDSVDVMGAGDLPLIFCAVMSSVGISVLDDGDIILTMMAVLGSVFVATLVTRYFITGKFLREIPAAPAIITATHYLLWVQLL